MKENLAVIFGGVSCEHDISIISAIQAIKNIDTNFYNIIPIYITKSGVMLTGKKLIELSTFSNMNYKKFKPVTFVSGSNNLYLKSLFGYTKKQIINVALVIMHGENGEDGKIMSMLSLCGIPYSACDQMQSAICMDKCVFKDYLKGLKINTVSGLTVFDYDYLTNPEKVKKQVLKQLNYPVILKPATLGSSIGIKIANNESELEAGLVVAFNYCNKVLIESYLSDITEINVALLGFNNDVTISETEQPVKQNDIVTFDNKYMGNSSAGMANLKRIIPADVSAEIAEEVKQTALKIFNSLSLKGVVRFDFIVDNKTNKVYVNELNTIPGSLAFYLFNPIDITYKQLINKLIKFAYIAHDNEQKLIKTFNSSVLDKTNIGSGLKK